MRSSLPPRAPLSLGGKSRVIVARKGAQEGNEGGDLFVREGKRADRRIFVGIRRSALDVITHNILKRCERPVVHIRRRQRDIAKRRGLELVKIFGLERDFLPPTIVERLLRLTCESLAFAQIADARIVKRMIGEEGPLIADEMARRTPRLPRKQIEALLRGVG